MTATDQAPSSCRAPCETGAVHIWIPGSQAVPAPRKDAVFEFSDHLFRRDSDLGHFSSSRVGHPAGVELAMTFFAKVIFLFAANSATTRLPRHLPRLAMTGFRL